MSLAIVDVLAIGPHPDDADLGVGGTLLSLNAAGLRTAILDLSRGEMGSRGTVQERAEEAKKSAALLGVCARENAELSDGVVLSTDPVGRETHWHQAFFPVGPAIEVEKGSVISFALDTGSSPHKGNWRWYGTVKRARKRETRFELCSRSRPDH